MTLRSLCTVLAVLLLSLAACSQSLTGGEEELTLYVAPETRTCMGPDERQCLLVREDPSGPWLNFYDQIEGFSYEAGYHYTLRVRSRRIANPPADGSSVQYRLVRVIEKRPA